MTAQDATEQARHKETGIPRIPPSVLKPLKEQIAALERHDTKLDQHLSKPEVRDYIRQQNQLLIKPRTTSRRRKGYVRSEERAEAVEKIYNIRRSPEPDDLQHEVSDALTQAVVAQSLESLQHSHLLSRQLSIGAEPKGLDLRNTRHVDLHGHKDFGLSRYCRHQPVARDWPVGRKRWTAAVACLNTALIGIIVGIYAGEVPAIQYAIADLNHWVILGNAFLYIGLAIPTLLLWPLPLLHGRKPYVIGAMAVALPLQIPQAIAVGAFRSPYTRSYRVLLLFCRGLSGLALGFAVINFKTTLLDLFGASLMSSNPHQEYVSENDVRRHGGGIGLWLGWWTWCTMGSISIGFLVGASIIDTTNVTWGFWVSIFCMMCTMFLNIITPEVRRSAYRRTMSEILKRDGGDMRRLARGEIKMHLRSRGPLWWGEEVKAGMELSWKMLRQPGFLVLALYAGWVHAQFTLVLMLLGALISQYYKHRPIYVGLCVCAMAVGALLATPFQKANFFSRSRHHPQRTDSMTVRKRVTMSSHLIRRLIFLIILPLAAIGYTLTGKGPPLSAAWPTFFAALVAFLSNLAIAECNGLIMETFDVSDIPQAITGRRQSRSKYAEYDHKQKSNYTCHPRVTAGFVMTQGISYILLAAATASGGGILRRLGAHVAIAVVAAVLMGLTVALIVVLIRFRTVKMTPEGKERRPSAEWEPVIIGNPSGTTRLVNWLELGEMSRWMEIRRRNRLEGDRSVR